MCRRGRRRQETDYDHWLKVIRLLGRPGGDAGSVADADGTPQRRCPVLVLLHEKQNRQVTDFDLVEYRRRFPELHIQGYGEQEIDRLFTLLLRDRFELCFPAQGQRRPDGEPAVYIVPQLLPYQAPDYDWEAADNLHSGRGEVYCPEAALDVPITGLLDGVVATGDAGARDFLDREVLKEMIELGAGLRAQPVVAEPRKLGQLLGNGLHLDSDWRLPADPMLALAVAARLMADKPPVQVNVPVQVNAHQANQQTTTVDIDIRQKNDLCFELSGLLDAGASARGSDAGASEPGPLR